MKKTKVFFCGITSANIVMTAERDVTKANPPESSVESGSRGGKKEGVTPCHTLVSPENLRKMRQAHDNLSDAEFDELTQEAIETDEPLTRSKLQRNR